MPNVISKAFIKVLGGTRNERLVRAMRKTVEEQINPLEGRMVALSPQELAATTQGLRERLAAGASPKSLIPEAFAAVREASRSALDPDGKPRNHRQFDVQLIAGLVLYGGNIAEEATGEGKTIACYPAIYMSALEGRKVHVVTVNDYLVKRDADFAKPIFELLGLTVGYIQTMMDNAERKVAYACDVTYGTNSEFGFDYLRDNMKFSKDDQVQGPLDFAIVDEVDNILIDEARTPLIISGPAGGDIGRYAKADQIARKLEELQEEENRNTAGRIRDPEELNKLASRDNFKEALKKFKADPSQRSGFALTEDEAQALKHRQYFAVQAENKNVSIMHEGVTEIQKDPKLWAIYQEGAEWPHLITQALRARIVYKKDRDYVVRGQDVVIVDEFTGRLMEGRQWSEGLHQAVEAKEAVRIKRENQTLATITLQNYFKLYKKLAGMTGTAMTEAAEFVKIYGLDVISVPSHRPLNRADHDDRIYRSEAQKFQAIVEEIRHEAIDKGRPVLVGTTSVEKSERLSEALTRQYGIEHEVLNARPEKAKKESDIVKMAGHQHRQKGSNKMVGNVTIATNMAGRGTDIKLEPGVVCAACKVPADGELPAGIKPSELFPAGMNKCCMRCPEADLAGGCDDCFKPKLDDSFPHRGRQQCEQEAYCGLHVVGTERHEARRIDEQLRGRSGRQGDPGSSRFFLSLEDDLMRVFAGPAVLKLLDWLGMEDGMAIEHKRITKAIEQAQKRVEERNFDIRKNLLEYDEVMDHQRRTYYGRRQRVLEGRDLKELIVEMISQTVQAAVADHLDGPYSKRCISDWARTNLRLDVAPEQVRGEGPEDFESVAEDLRARAKDDAAADILRSLGEYIDSDASPHQLPDDDDASQGEEIDPYLGRREPDLAGLVSWAMSRFSVNLSQNQLRKMTSQQISDLVTEQAHARIDQIDLAPVATYLPGDFPRVALGQWAAQKFGVRIPPEDLAGSVEEVAARLLGVILAAHQQREVEYPIELAMMRAFPDGNTANVFHCNALADWVNAKYRAGLAGTDFVGKRPREIFEMLLPASREYAVGDRLEQEVEAHLTQTSGAPDHVRFAQERFDTSLTEQDFADRAAREVLLETGQRFLRREINEWERLALLVEFDGAWKDHLLEMDHLRSGIGLRGYAELDPKVAYKREGSVLFQEMLDRIPDRVAENIFKVRQSASARLSSVYQISQMVHEQLAGYDHLSQEMQAQQDATRPQKIETIRRELPKVGRNEPCPCGSGKKYKKCCGLGQ